MFKTGIFKTIYLCELEFKNIMLIKPNTEVNWLLDLKYLVY